MKTVHMTLAPKGGIGKSLIASVLTQWVAERDGKVVAFDNDPATATLQAYKGLPVRKLDLVRDGAVNKHAYDDMFMAMTTEDAVFVVDNGASNFLELTSYIQTSGLVDVLSSVGVKPVIHVPVVGGDDLVLTAAGVKVVADSLSPAADMVVWLNLYKGPIVGNGVPWEKMPVYTQVKDRVRAEVTIAKRDDMTNAALQRMLGDRLTFAEVRSNERYNLFDKQRLQTFKADIFDQLDQVLGRPVASEAA